MKKLLPLFLVLMLCVLLACEGKQGPIGPQGPPGVSLIKEYTGEIPADGHHTLDVPEILGKQKTTFVMAYWTYPTTPDAWIPMTDGRLDDANSARIFAVDWTQGQVVLWGMLTGDLFLLQVFEHT